MAEGDRAKVHNLQGRFAANLVKSKKDAAAMNPLHHASGMDVWVQKDRFKECLRSHQDAHGLTQEQVAAQLGITLNSLRQILYQPSRRPSLETIQRAAALFGVPLSEFLDDPGTPPPGVPAQDFAAMSEEERMLARLIIHDLQRIAPDRKRTAVDAWVSLMRTIGFIQ